MLHKILYYASGAPSGIYPCANNNPTEICPPPGARISVYHLLIVGRLDVDGQSFAPISLHKTDAASDWLLLKRHYIGTKGLLGIQLQN